MKKKIVAIFLCLVIGMSGFNCFEKLVYADSKSWNVYYSTAGGNADVQKLTVATYGHSYRATCSTLSGNCAYRAINVTCYADYACTSANNVELNKDVKFSVAGKKIDFELKTVPSQANVYYKVVLSHSGGTTANSTGTIKTI